MEGIQGLKSDPISTTITTMEKKREYWIDVLRCFACVMVLFCHAPAPDNAKSMIGTAFGMVNAYLGMAWGPVLFFMISGACVLWGGQDSARVFFKKRFSRVLCPTIVWSVVYVLLEQYVWKTNVSSVSHKLLMIPFAPQYGLLWFMYVIIAIYLVTPIFSVWLERCSKKDLQLYLAIWAITLLFPYVRVSQPEISSGLMSGNGLLYYFGGWMWVAVFGYYCRRYVNIQLRVWHYTLILIVPLSVLAFKLLSGETITNCLSIASVFATAYAFVIIQNTSFKGVLRKQVEVFSKYSFGIYLCHMLFIHPFRIWISQFGFDSYIQIPITVIVCGTCTYLLVWLISKLPFSKYIIG
ncbi:MAG: acyltransferase [Bacteroidales bacterium]|nr:acyltransferase [Bacteroidales bacterium]